MKSLRIAQLESFLVASPDDPFTLYALAHEYVKEGDDATARTYFDRTLAADPKYVGVFYHYGALLERTGEPDAAVKMYERGIEIARGAREARALAELNAALQALQDARDDV